MAMSSREKLLAAGVGLVATLFIGRTAVMSVQSGFTAKEGTIEALQKKKENQELQMTAGAVASQKLLKVVSSSLPKSEEKAQADYLEWLISLADEAKLVDPKPQFTGDSKDPRDAAYHAFKFQLTGVGTIENLTQLLYGFYAKDYLHRITRLSMAPLPNAKEPDQLQISLDCEALALTIAKEKQESPRGKSPRVTKSLEAYQEQILNRNLFARKNNPPELAPEKAVDATQGMSLNHMVEAKDPDLHQLVTMEIVGDPPTGLSIDQSSGKLSWTPKEIGEYLVSVKATDNGIPKQSTVQSLTIKVKEPPPPAPTPVQFDVASQAKLTGLVTGKSGPEAWISSKADSKTYKLRKGDEFKLGGIVGIVKEIGANYVEIETQGRKWLVGQDESVADAYKRSTTD